MTKRITYLDSLKAILILLVILGHAVQFNTEEYETNPLFQFIYSFHMPLFLFISGYLTCRGSFKGGTLESELCSYYFHLSPGL